MKKNFTQLFSAIFILALIAGFNANAQTMLASANTTSHKTVAVKKDSLAAKRDSIAAVATFSDKKSAIITSAPQTDTAWHPQRRLWGYAFGDEYYAPHTDAGNRGSETNYAGVPSNRNAFQFRRLYFGYDYEITKKFKAEVLLASEPTANVGTVGTSTVQNSDNLADNKMSFYIKNFNLRVRDLWTGTDLVVGELSTPGFALNEPGTNAPTSLSEATWAYRSIERTVTDFHKNNSYDVGAALQGTFDPATKNFGYVLMVSNNSQASLLSAANANTGFYKIFYGDIWGKFFNNHLYADFYYHVATTAPGTATISTQSNNMEKIFVSYLSKPITIGVELYTQQFTNGVTNSTTKLPENAQVNAGSFWVRGPIVKKLNFFARYDTYNPDNNFNIADSYSVNTNYSGYNPTNKEQFYTAGLDYQPTKNVHFMPNFWLVDYKDQRATTTTGYVPGDHTLVLRATFFYTFGK
jgi:hypothetical protein